MRKNKISKDLSKIKKKVKKLEFDEKIKEISIDYYNKSEKDRIILENILNDSVNNIDKLSLASLFVFILPPLIKAAGGDSGGHIIAAYLVLYLTFGGIASVSISKYRFDKIYLKTIQDIRDQRIDFEISKEVIEKINIVYKSLNKKSI